MRDFATATKGAPVLCVGASDYQWLLFDLLVEMTADPSAMPGPIVIPSDDALASNSQLREILQGSVRAYVLELPLTGLLRELDNATRTAFTPPLGFEIANRSIAEQLSMAQELVVVANYNRAPKVAATEVHRLQDLLFSPDVPQWEPFAYDLDFPRNVTPEIAKAIHSASLASTKELPTVAITGAAATGKTTILKRLAFTLAGDKCFVLWFRPYFFQDGPARLREFFALLSKSTAFGRHPVIAFVDDPTGLGSVRLDDIAKELRELSTPTVLVLGVQTTEWTAAFPSMIPASCAIAHHIYVPDTFDDIELAALPSYLMKLGIASVETEARRLVNDARSRSARDVLAMLYWLLPQTKGYINHSVKKEYFRLGDRTEFATAIFGHLTRTSTVLRTAYELVAVSQKYGTALPIEVLVSSLEIGYDEWRLATPTLGITWGLLYADRSDDLQSTVYRTRNAIVRDIVVEAVNGGALGRAGEIAALERLLSACNGTSPAYREFCLRILVPYNSNQMERLDYEEGLLLYQAALRSLPFEDRTLVHHYGLWQKVKGNDPIAAEVTLHRALNTKIYPYSSRGEPAEHIYNSLAANEVLALRLQRVSILEGRQKALGYLERARSTQFANPNAVHVQAKLIVELADLTGSPSDADSIGLFDRALADVDRMVLQLRTAFGESEESKKHIEMLDDVRGQVVTRCGSLATVRSDAQLLWESHKRQDGFVLVARILYNKALSSNQGTDFMVAFGHCQAVAKTITEAGVAVSVELREVMLHIYFQWQVRRLQASGRSEPIDWQLLRDLAAEVASAHKSVGDPFYRYVTALAEAHLGQWARANSIFEQLRRERISSELLYEDRDLLLTDRGAMQRVQGVVHRGPNRGYLAVEGLKHDFPLNRFDNWNREGEIDHAYIRFRFAGEVAVKHL